ncbi:MAG: (d)CMP kinase [Bacteroidota bacterium]
MQKKGLIIAIDGPAGAGKSTVAKLVAQKLGYLYLDTGAMYRALTWKALQQPDWSEQALASLAQKTALELEATPEGTRVVVDGQDVTQEIRTPEVTNRVSHLAKVAPVREVMVAHQRQIGEAGAVVIEGRDIGSTVFPQAEVKIFLTASPLERARRRMKDFEAQGVGCSLEELAQDIQKRDHLDSTRTVSPLKPAEDAIPLDSDGLSAQEIADRIVSISRGRGA